jgi:hypothetical protein
MFSKFLFLEILELIDLDWKGPGGPDNCNQFHLMPRFARSLPGITFYLGYSLIQTISCSVDLSKLNPDKTGILYQQNLKLSPNVGNLS